MKLVHAVQIDMNRMECTAGSQTCSKQQVILRVEPTSKISHTVRISFELSFMWGSIYVKTKITVTTKTRFPLVRFNYFRGVARLGKVTSAVRETDVSRQNGGPIKGTPFNPSIRWCCDVRGVKEGPQSGLHDAEKGRSLGQL